MKVTVESLEAEPLNLRNAQVWKYPKYLFNRFYYICCSFYMLLHSMKDVRVLSLRKHI